MLDLIKEALDQIAGPMRYDKLAANYLAFVQLASIRLWLRVNKSTSSNDRLIDRLERVPRIRGDVGISLAGRSG